MDAVGMLVEQYGPSVAEQSGKNERKELPHMIKITKQKEIHIKIVCKYSYIACTSIRVTISHRESKSQC
jgi:hypothetical protein